MDNAETEPTDLLVAGVFGPSSKIIAGDSTELIKTVAEASIDLAILDPNYNDWDSLCASGFMDDVYRTLKSTGNIICFTKQPFDLNLRNFVNPYFRREIIWSFSNGGAWVSPKMPLVSFQKLYWLAASDHFYFNARSGLDYDPKTKSVKRSTKVFGNYREEGKEFIKSDEGTWIRDHYHFNKPANARIFAKPLELIQILVRCFCPDGGMVFDPFFGSGATGDACINTGRNFIGFEIDADAIDSFNAEREARLF